MSRPCPCNGCVAPKRHRGCHATCPDYIPWNEEHQQELAIIREAKEQEHYFPPSLKKKVRSR